jgi:pyruvate formate lyase activating enzyme
MNTIEYFKIESFSTVDGFGNRMVVFLNHCPYRCVYCHNPECWFKSKKKINVKKIIVEFEKTKEFYKNGGITLSGGEPLIQYDFCKELAKECKKRNINLCIDTSGYFFDKKKISKLLENDVFFLIDIKHTVKK